uniref:non-specific serine/threonine protein kinase n=1 Tax=Haptolina brevifila TaxID=156173 RepID=A0A7S2D336_9EUKA
MDESEAHVLRSLDHPGIVRYHDSFFTDENSLCIVMEYCHGGDLASMIRNRASSGELAHFSEENVIDMFVQIVQSLKYLHGRRVLHRDLKPQNILLSSSAGESPRLLLADFGIAKVLEEANSAAATVLGTPTYLAPEICKGQRYSYPADVWSLGCILHELIALTKVWATTNLLAAVYKICEQEPPPLPNCPGLYSYDCQQLVNEMLSKDPSQRPTLDEILRRPMVRAAAERLAAQQQLGPSAAQQQLGPSYGFQRKSLEPLRISPSDSPLRSSECECSGLSSDMPSGGRPSDAEADGGQGGARDKDRHHEEAGSAAGDGCGGESERDLRCSSGIVVGRASSRRAFARCSGAMQPPAMRPGKSMGGLLRRMVPKGHLPRSISPSKLPSHQAPTGHLVHNRRCVVVAGCRTDHLCARGSSSPVNDPPLDPLDLPAAASGVEEQFNRSCIEREVAGMVTGKPPLEGWRKEASSPWKDGADEAMEEAWYYKAANNREEGPFEEEMLVLMHALGDLSDKTPVWNPHTGAWAPMSAVAKQWRWTDDEM